MFFSLLLTFKQSKKGASKMFSLNGTWNFYTSDKEIKEFKEISFKEQIEIPSCTEEFFEEHKEHMFFKKEFAIDLDSEKRKKKGKISLNLSMLMHLISSIRYKSMEVWTKR